MSGPAIWSVLARMYIDIDFVYRKLGCLLLGKCCIFRFMLATCVILLSALSGLNLASLKFLFSLFFPDISRLSRSPSPLQSNGKCVFVLSPFQSISCCPKTIYEICPLHRDIVYAYVDTSGVEHLLGAATSGVLGFTKSLSCFRFDKKTINRREYQNINPCLRQPRARAWIYRVYITGSG